MTSLLDRAWEEARAREARLDPKVRRERGVVHTPPEVARHVVRRLEAVLRASGLAAGLDDPRLTYVDPAIGTGVFAAALVERAGSVRMIGLDLDGDALAITRRLLGDRMALTLRHQSPLTSIAPDPAIAADAPGPIVVIGNPPWAGRSQSRGVALSDALLADFDRDEHGRALGERKKGVLSDDYVRFTRWALEVVRLRGDGGALALVTNASWIDGPVHRGMRRMLVADLPHLEIVDLGGSALIGRERGARDASVFGVRVSASIVVGARGPNVARAVSFAALSGSIEDKHAALAAPELSRVSVHPAPPAFALRPRREVPQWYRDAPSIAAWMPFHREGLQTNRDAIAIDRDPRALVARAEAIARGEVPLPARAHFDPVAARARLAEALSAGLTPRAVAYRPFDVRFYLPTSALVHRPRPDLQRAIERSVGVLVTTRKDRGRRAFAHLVMCAEMPDNCVLSARSSCRARGFPTHDPDGAPNLGAAVATRLGEVLGAIPSMDAVHAWLAAHLGSPAWCADVDEALRADFPRVPVPRDRAGWDEGVAVGRKIAAAFAVQPSGTGTELVIGHHTVAGAEALAAARAGADRAHRSGALR